MTQKLSNCKLTSMKIFRGKTKVMQNYTSFAIMLNVVWSKSKQTNITPTTHIISTQYNQAVS